MFKNFLRDSIGFSFANIFIKSINIILIPIYVRFLSFEDYGIFELVTTLTIIFVAVVSLEVTQSILRFVSDSKSSPSLQIKYIKTGIHIIILSSALFLLIAYSLSPLISDLIFKTKIYSELVELTAWIISFQSLNYCISVVHRAEKNFYYAIRHSIIVALLSGTFALTCLIYSSGSLKALLLGQTIGASFAALIGIYGLKERLSLQFDFDIAKTMLMFSFPLIFSAIAIHLSSFADRIIINELLSLEALAIYGIAAKAASIITILIAGVQGTLSPHFISTWNSEFGLNSLVKIFFIYLAISIFLLIFLNIYGEYILIFLGTSAAVGGTKVLILLASSSIVNGLNIFLFGLIKALKTSLLGLIFFFTAALNVYLNFLLIKGFGIEGAAFATLISASFGFLVHYYFSSKYLKMPFSNLIPICFIISILLFNILIIYIA